MGAPGIVRTSLSRTRPQALRRQSVVHAGNWGLSVVAKSARGQAPRLASK